MDISLPVRTYCVPLTTALLVVILSPVSTTAQHVAPPLPPPSGRVVQVSTVAQLQAAVTSLTTGTSIVIAPGVYRLTQMLRIRNGVTDVALRGATNNRADVVILGSGMNTSGVNIAVSVEDAQEVLIANLSIGEAFWHPIQLHGELGAERVHVYNVRLFNAGQQFLKSSVDSRNPAGVDDVIVEYSLIEYTTLGPAHGYTQGIDAHHVANWIIRYNLFRNIRVPASAQYRQRPAILIWSGSRETVVHSNTIVNCERGIIFGLGAQAGYPHSHTGGEIFNNVIYRTERVNADSGISVWDSPGTRVYHNTVIQNGTYPVSIEYRFASTTGVQIANNLTDGTIIKRDNAQATVYSNYTQATPAMFVDAAGGDLHLDSDASQAIDRGVSLADVSDDWDGDPRPTGTAPDLGADEVSSATSNRPPVARATASPTAGPVPLTVSFSGAASADPDGDTLTYSWTFGDGRSGSGVTASNTYAAAGTYTATLTVKDSAGAQGTAKVVITVAGAGGSGGGSVLAAPTELRAAVAGRRVTLTWRDNANRETAYIMERATGGGAFAALAQLARNTVTYTHTAANAGVYRYRVRAFDSVGGVSSAYSNAVEVRIR